MSLLVCLALLAATPVFAQETGGESDGWSGAREQLAVELARSAVLLLGGEAMSLQSAANSSALLFQARSLDPANTDLARLHLQLATLTEREELVEELLRTIADQDPHDQVIRLRRISLALERYQTAPERMSAIETLLQPERRAELGTAEASRLALDLAHLYRRAGDIEAFAHWLSEAVAIDPSNRSAAALAAGYFRLNVNDPYGEAELLAALILSDPSNITAHVTLARLLLDHGAYRGAAQLYAMAIGAQRVSFGIAAGELIADLAIARWAEDDSEQALRTIRDYQIQLNERLRDRAIQDNPNLDVAELRQFRYPVSPTLGTVRAMILHELSRDERVSDLRLAAADDAREQLLHFYTLGLELAGEEGATSPAELASTRLKFAMALLWLNEDVDRVDELLREAEEFEPLTDAARTRFQGWLAYRRGELDHARSLLESVAEEDLNARVGLALTLVDLGERREGARHLLAVARQSPGNLVGVLAYNRLSEILGRRVALTDLADRLNQLVDTIPRAFGRYSVDPTLALGLSARPAKWAFNAFEPVVLTIEITNNSRYPLAIDRQGPIKPQIVIAPRVELLSGTANDVEPIFIDIDRRLRLMPRETLQIPVDLRLSRMGRLLNLNSLGGSTVSAQVMLNFRPGPVAGVLEPGLLGLKSKTGPFRVNGVRVSDEWVSRTAELVRDPDTPNRIPLLGLLSRVTADRPPDGSLPPELRSRIIAASEAFNEVFPTLSTYEQAWLLTVAPGTAELAPSFRLARQNPDRTMMLTYLIFKATSPEDPVVVAAKQSDDPSIASLAEIIETIFIRGAEAVRADPSLLGR